MLCTKNIFKNNKKFSLNHSVFAPLFCTFITFCSLYAPQVLLPDFTTQFEQTAIHVSLLMTFPLLGLAIVPFFYGILVGRSSLIKILRMTMIFLGITLLLFGMSDHFFLLLILRAVQGIILSILMTSIMTYISKAVEENKVKESIQLYIGITVVGGFSGRFISGILNDLFDWPVVFYCFGLLSFFGSFWLFFAKNLPTSIEQVTSKKNKIKIILKNPICFTSYILIFLLFYCFVSVLNYLPFYLRSLDSSLKTSELGIHYLGYLFGIVMSINTNKILRITKSTFNGIILAISLFIVGLFLIQTTQLNLIFYFIFIISIGFFLLHSILTSYINHQVRKHTEVANGFYISFYYLSASAGSCFSGLIYYQFGWLFLIYFLIFISFFAFIISILSRFKFKIYQ